MSNAFWLITPLILLNITCKNEIPSPNGLQNQLSKVLEIRYSPDPQYANKSSKPPILYQGTRYYDVASFETSYRYDIQGRLTFEKQMDPNNPTNTYTTEYNTYTYSGNKVIKFFSNTSSKDTLTLNSFGYAISSSYLRNQTTYEYDQRGFLLKKQTSYVTFSQVVDENNVKKQVEQRAFGTTTTTEFSYDLTRQALVDPRNLFTESKGSNNLTTQIITRRTSDFSAPNTLSISYSYLFDEQDRVKQQISLQEGINGYPILTIKYCTYVN